MLKWPHLFLDLFQLVWNVARGDRASPSSIGSDCVLILLSFCFLFFPWNRARHKGSGKTRWQENLRADFFPPATVDLQKKKKSQEMWGPLQRFFTFSEVFPSLDVAGILLRKPLPWKVIRVGGKIVLLLRKSLSDIHFSLSSLSISVSWCLSRSDKVYLGTPFQTAPPANPVKIRRRTDRAESADAAVRFKRRW